VNTRFKKVMTKTIYSYLVNIKLAGFGWSNGVILDLLNSYGDKMSASKAGITGTTWFSIAATIIFSMTLHFL
jgi:hypothetical protein